MSKALMTSATLPAVTVECFANPAANRMTPYGARRTEILGADALALAQRELSQWQGYATTPLHSLPALAAALGLAAGRGLKAGRGAAAMLGRCTGRGAAAGRPAISTLNCATAAFRR